jgi:energy-coupling factor transport system ATP-binding protein
LLELDHVTYRYPGYARGALDDVDLAIQDGEVVGLTGPNGSGKSTLCLVASGLAPAAVGGELRGEVRVDGTTLRGLRSHQLAGKTGLVFANAEAQRTRVAATVFEEVAFGPVNLGLTVPETVARTRTALSALGIEALAERHPARLSGGQAQLVAIASMLAMRPRHLVLDEPVAELDGHGRRLVGDALSAIGAAGTGLLVAEHDLDLIATLATRAIEMRDGRIGRQGPPNDVLGSSTKEVERPPAVADGTSAAPIAIRCEGVAYDFPDGTRALDGIDLTIRAGERVAIVGRNGSGKTTLVRTWNGVLRPTSGRVEIAGQSTAGRHVAALARSIGLTFQESDRQIFAGTCRAEVAFGARNVGLTGRELEAAIAEALEAVGLADQAATNPYDLGPSRRRLLAVASVLAMRTPILVLDEPTMGLDVDERARVRSIVKGLAEAGRTVVAISHDARFVRASFDRVVTLAAGRVVGDGPSRAAAPASRLAKGSVVFGTTVLDPWSP